MRQLSEEGIRRRKRVLVHLRDRKVTSGEIRALLQMSNIQQAQSFLNTMAKEGTITSELVYKSGSPRGLRIWRLA